MLKLFGMLSVLVLLGAGCFDASSTTRTEGEVEMNGGEEVMQEERTEEDAESEAEAEAEAETETRTVVLEEQNDSGQSGTAVLVEEDGKTMVTLDVSGSTSGVAQPAHIHVGTCATIGAIQYPLTAVVDGSSETVLDLTIADILASSAQLSVNVHESVPEVDTYVACGNLKL